MTVLLTGGAGNIGPHTCIELLRIRKSVVVLDNLSNGNPEALRRPHRSLGSHATERAPVSNFSASRR